ncbi:GntR family transcriptional regulator [Amorphus sp. 3PC139-8]|uniref:GntR family transcriptional regulator n=1 Tax=Amorphus sp. 3PC139-8 TaxID=2735676 RepID=UPI00345D3173
MARGHDANGNKNDPLYMTVFRELQAEIARGVFPVGTPLPSEAALVERFGVSRQTVRQALRNLKESGLVTSHQGLGTIVERPGLSRGYVHQVDTISDLFPVDVDTRYQPTDGKLAPLPGWAADRFPAEAEGTKWLHVRAFRFRPPETAPFNQLDAFVAAPFAGLSRVIETHRGPIYGLVEAMYGELIDEVRQTIGSFIANDQIGPEIGLKVGEPGIAVDRVYKVKSSGSVAILSVNLYPVEKFTFSMTLRRLQS